MNNFFLTGLDEEFYFTEEEILILISFEAHFLRIFSAFGLAFAQILN